MKWKGVIASKVSPVAMFLSMTRYAIISKLHYEGLNLSYNLSIAHIGYEKLYFLLSFSIPKKMPPYLWFPYGSTQLYVSFLDGLPHWQQHQSSPSGSGNSIQVVRVLISQKQLFTSNHRHDIFVSNWKKF